MAVKEEAVRAAEGLGAGWVVEGWEVAMVVEGWEEARVVVGWVVAGLAVGVRAAVVRVAEGWAVEAAVVRAAVACTRSQMLSQHFCNSDRNNHTGSNRDRHQR